MNIKDISRIHVMGHLKIYDPSTDEIFLDKHNAIHYENMSIAVANSLADSGTGVINSMVFGNGGSTIDPTGIITYLSPNTNGSNASLYNQTFSKIVNTKSTMNVDPTRNFIETRHVSGVSYSDIFISCLLDYGEPDGQSAFDNTNNNQSDFVFDELGLKSADGLLLTHVMFHPIQKSLNRMIQIDYTVRFQSLSGV